MAPRQRDGQRKAKQPTSPQAISETERAIQAIELRRAGATFDQIAKQLNYADRSGPYKAVTKLLREMKRESAEEYVTLELSRNERLFLAVWSPAIQGDLKAIAECRQLMESRWKLLGLDKASPPWGGGAEELDVAAIAAELGSEFGLETTSVLAEVEQIIREARQ